VRLRERGVCGDSKRRITGRGVVLDKATADEVVGVFWCDFCCRSRSVQLRDGGRDGGGGVTTVTSASLWTLVK